MIQGISSQSDLYSAYKSIQPQKISNDVSAVSSGIQPDKDQQEKVNNEAASIRPKTMDLRLSDIAPRQQKQNLSVEDVSVSLNESAASFEMKGRDSDIKDLDMEKAVSDMQKDAMLMQYQYFVGDSNPFQMSEDGIVIQK